MRTRVPLRGSHSVMYRDSTSVFVSQMPTVFYFHFFHMNSLFAPWANMLVGNSWVKLSVIGTSGYRKIKKKGKPCKRN